MFIHCQIFVAVSLVFDVRWKIVKTGKDPLQLSLHCWGRGACLWSSETLWTQEPASCQLWILSLYCLLRCSSVIAVALQVDHQVGEGLWCGPKLHIDWSVCTRHYPFATMRVVWCGWTRLTQSSRCILQNNQDKYTRIRQKSCQGMVFCLCWRWKRKVWSTWRRRWFSLFLWKFVLLFRFPDHLFWFISDVW